MSEHNGQVVAYVRVSSLDQNTDRQDVGDVDRIFEEHVSGKDRERPQLGAMLSYVREGDTVRVWAMDRLARSLIDLENLVNDLTAAGVTVEFISERLTFKPDSDDPYATFQRQVIGAVAQLERSIIHRRQAEGIAKAKARGVYKGRKPCLTADQIEAAREKVAFGVPKAAIARELSVSRQTLYDALSGRGYYAAQDTPVCGRT